MRGWAASILVLLSACARHPEAPLFTGEPYLLVWAGDADRQNSDFLAVLDADPTSPSYGKVLRTYPVRSRGNEPQALIATPRADRRVFASGVLTNRTFVLAVPRPLAPRLVHIDEPGAGRRFGAPHEYVTLPNGHVLGTCTDALRYRGEPREILGAPGGLVELDADGGFVRELPAADSAARHLIIAPFGAAALGGGPAITPAERFLVEALAGSSRVVALDLADPWHPKLVSAVRLDRDPLDTSKARGGGPHAVAMSTDGTRIAVADYTVDVPGYRQDGAHRVYMLRLDPATGRLRIDGAFQDERTGEVGVSFERASWPHGETGPARPAGLPLLTAAPPPAEGRREAQ